MTKKIKRLSKRVVIIGGEGFIGSHVASNLKSKKINFLSLGKKEVDLLDCKAAEKLKEILRNEDVVVFLAAIAPCKNISMFQKNLKMVQSFLEAIDNIKLSQLVYISSDAVYKDSTDLISENTCAQPNSLHGAMHLSRELALQAVDNCTISIVRPTLVYGLKDPHNGYGPNSFVRLINSGEIITLHGRGEELRDHIAVEDVAEIVTRVILENVHGVINAVTGRVVSFEKIAKYVAANFNMESKIAYKQRKGQMPHNGYRAFDNSYLYKVFPDLKLNTWEIGIKKLCSDHKINNE